MSERGYSGCGENLHEISNSISWKNKKTVIDVSSAKLVQRVVKVERYTNISSEM